MVAWETGCACERRPGRKEMLCWEKHASKRGERASESEKKALEISCPGESMTGCSKWAEEELGQTGAPSTRPYVSFEKCHAVFITNKSPFDYNP